MKMNWWRPSKFHVTYFKKPEAEWHDKYKYDTLVEAQARLEYLNSITSEEDLKKEGIEFVPNYFRILQVTSPTQLEDYLTFTVQKIMYKIFGVWI